MAATAAAASPLTPLPPFFQRPSFPRFHVTNLFLRNPNPTSSSTSIIVSGPRDNRQPIRRGRTLSTEAILTVQALKRARNDEAAVERIVSTSVARLIRADLLAALTELQRQDQWQLALKLFEVARRENWYRTDCALYADMVSSLTRSKRDSEIDILMVELMEELQMGGGALSGDLRGPARLVKALVAAGKGKAVKDVYEMMKRGGCEPNEYLFKFMIKGLRGLGEEDAACEIEKDYELWGFGGFGAEPLAIL
ncbi:protein THYLAKOID ASSEMBLY 8, chloroplastic-like [Dendrobium catenatum]|uniref:Pentatricopeptide repeat-containing protein n=1 Tax=Dendrobium catenatum TaxID=906689 RepID=A0A2I0WLK2_9ASPA|nr:protein THYLAKOID ASSEMBLY 8, chloroplastic-like [Dendrobium catenatum]XP_020696425.1 protein THYLAKOID ASSEMBLY 8, chloroplastic-like [Dendrobium catenatum]PKU76528.1 Pentatricopeptide repeat-containing protein [Dendrobium catenatum]